MLGCTCGFGVQLQMATVKRMLFVYVSRGVRSMAMHRRVTLPIKSMSSYDPIRSYNPNRYYGVASLARLMHQEMPAGMHIGRIRMAPWGLYPSSAHRLYPYPYPIF